MDFHRGKTNRHVPIHQHVSLISAVLAVTLDVALIFCESVVLRDHGWYPAARWPFVRLPKGLLSGQHPAIGGMAGCRRSHHPRLCLAIRAENQTAPTWRACLN